MHILTNTFHYYFVHSFTILSIHQGNFAAKYHLKLHSSCFLAAIPPKRTKLSKMLFARRVLGVKNWVLLTEVGRLVTVGKGEWGGGGWTADVSKPSLLNKIDIS